MNEILQLDVSQAEAALPELIGMLQDAVNNGASLGFHTPLHEEEARSYWEEVIDAMRKERRILFVSRTSEKITGTVQLDLEPRTNGRHRAEIQKLMVHTSERSKGLGSELMEAAEGAAREQGRTLILLDVRRGNPAEFLYRKRGYIEIGTIPNYTVDADGLYHDTLFFYRTLPNETTTGERNASR